MFKKRGVSNFLREDATLIFRNFAGKEGKYNREGDRNFCVLLDDDTARDLEVDGWNVKTLRAREEGDVPQPYLPVSVSYKKIPPKVTLVTSRGKSHLEEDLLDLIDLIEIEEADVNIYPSEYNVNGNSGIKAYLRTLYIVVREDPLDLKYADVPELGRAPQQRELESSSPPAHYDIIDGEVVETPF